MGFSKGYSELMKDLRWDIERFVIIAIRHPQQYFVTLSAIVSGVFASLEVSAPIKQAIDDLPLLVGNNWLYYTLFLVLFWCIFNFLSWLLGLFFGLHPFEFIASYVDSLKIAPSLNDYVKKRLKNSSNPDSTSVDYRVRIIDKNELSEFNQLNRELFAFTAFSLPLQKIRKRNNRLFEANSLMFAMVDANIDGRFIPVGISHIIPLSDLGKALYVTNKGIKDSEIKPEHIAAEDEWSNAILMFSMGILPPFRNVLKDKYLTLPYVFAEHLIQLVSEMKKHYPQMNTTWIYSQTEKAHGGIGKMLMALGFENTDITTGDGFILWELKLDLPVITDQLIQAQILSIMRKDMFNNKLGRWAKEV